jgi:hypothetical protein
MLFFKRGFARLGSVLRIFLDHRKFQKIAKKNKKSQTNIKTSQICWKKRNKQEKTNKLTQSYNNFAGLLVPDLHVHRMVLPTIPRSDPLSRMGWQSYTTTTSSSPHPGGSSTSSSCYGKSLPFGCYVRHQSRHTSWSPRC